MVVLTKDEIIRLIQEENLIQNYVDLQTQLNDHGFDVTADKIYKLSGYSVIDFANELRSLPRYEELEFKKTVIREKEVEAVFLDPGRYVVELREIVKLPKDICAVVLPRSSLTRSGVSIESALWDAGYHGKGVLSMTVMNSTVLVKNARIGQMIFLKLSRSVEGYNGTYQFERIQNLMKR